MSSPIRLPRSERALAAEEKHRQRLSEKKATPNSNAFKPSTRSRQSASLGRPSHSPVYVPTRASVGTSSSLPRGGSEPRPVKQTSTTRGSGGRVLSYSAMSAAVESGLNPALRTPTSAKPVARASSARRATASPDHIPGETPASIPATVPVTVAPRANNSAPSREANLPEMNGAAVFHPQDAQDAPEVDVHPNQGASTTVPAEPVALSETGRAALALARLATSPRPQPRRPPPIGAAPASPAAASLEKTLGEVQAFSDLLSSGQRGSSSDAPRGGLGNGLAGHGGAGAAVEAAANVSGSSGVAERVRVALASAADRTQREAQLQQPPFDFHTRNSGTGMEGQRYDNSTRSAHLGSSNVSRGLPPLARAGPSASMREGIASSGSSATAVKVPAGIVSAAAALVFARNSGRSTPELPAASVSSSIGDAAGPDDYGNAYVNGSGSGGGGGYDGDRGGAFEDSNVSSAVSLGSGHFFGASEMETAASGSGVGYSARSSQAASPDELLYRPGDFTSDSSGDEREDNVEGENDDDEGYDDDEDEGNDREEHEEQRFEGEGDNDDDDGEADSDESEELLPEWRNRSEPRAAGVMSPSSDNATAGATSTGEARTTEGDATGGGDSGRGTSAYDARPISPGTELDDEAAAGRMAWFLREALGGSLGRPEDRRTLSSSSSAGRHQPTADAAVAGNAPSHVTSQQPQQQQATSQAAAPGPFERFASGAASTMASWSLGRASSVSRHNIVAEAEEDESVLASTRGGAVAGEDENGDVVNDRSSYSLSRGQARGIASGGDLVSHFLGALHNSVDVEEDEDEDEQSASTALSGIRSRNSGGDLRSNHGDDFEKGQSVDQVVHPMVEEPIIVPPPAAPAPGAAATARLAAYRNTRRRHEELSAQVISPARPTSPDDEEDNDEVERAAAAAAEADRRASAAIAAALAAAEDAATEAASLLSADDASILLARSDAQVKDSNPTLNADQTNDTHVDNGSAKKMNAEIIATKGAQSHEASGKEVNGQRQHQSQNATSPRQQPSYSEDATAAMPPLLPSGHYSPPLSPRSCSRSPAPPRRRNPLKLSPRAAGAAAATTRNHATTPQKDGFVDSGAGYDSNAAKDVSATSPNAAPWSPNSSPNKSAKHRRKTSPPLPPSPFVGMSSTALRAAELEADVVVEMVAAALRRSGSPMPKPSPSRKQARTYHEGHDERHFSGASGPNMHAVSRDDPAAALPLHFSRPSTSSQRQQQQSYAEFAAATKAAAVVEFDKGAQQALNAAAAAAGEGRNRQGDNPSSSSKQFLHRQKSTPTRTSIPLKVPQSAPPLGNKNKETSRLRGRKRLSDASPARSSGAAAGSPINSDNNTNKKLVKGAKAVSRYPPPRGRSQSLGGFEDLDTLRATRYEEGSPDSYSVTSHPDNCNGDSPGDREDANEGISGGSDGSDNGEKEEEQAGNGQRSSDEWGGNWGSFNPKLAYGTRVYNPSPHKDWPNEGKLPSYAMLARAADDQAAAAAAAPARAANIRRTPVSQAAPHSEDREGLLYGSSNGDVSSPLPSSSRKQRSKLKRSPSDSVSSFASARSKLSESHYLRASSGGGELGRHRKPLVSNADGAGEACVTRWAHWLSLSFISAALLAGSGAMLYQSYQGDLTTSWGNNPPLPPLYQGGGVSMAASRDTAAGHSPYSGGQVADNAGAHTPIKWNTDTSGHSTQGDGRGMNSGEGQGSHGGGSGRSQQRVRPPHATLWPRPSSKLREGGRIALKPEAAASEEEGGGGVRDVEAREAAEAEAAAEAIRQRLAARQAAHAQAEATSVVATEVAGVHAPTSKASATREEEPDVTPLPKKIVDTAASTPVEIATADTSNATETKLEAEMESAVKLGTDVTKPAATEFTPEPSAVKPGATSSKPVGNTMPNPAVSAAKPKTCSHKTAPFKLGSSTSSKPVPGVPKPKSCAAKSKTNEAKQSPTSTPAKSKSCSAKIAPGAVLKSAPTTNKPATAGAKPANDVAKAVTVEAPKSDKPVVQPTTTLDNSDAVDDKSTATSANSEVPVAKAKAILSKSGTSQDISMAASGKSDSVAEASTTLNKSETSTITPTSIDKLDSVTKPRVTADEAAESAAPIVNTSITSVLPTTAVLKSDSKSVSTEEATLNASLFFEAAKAGPSKENVPVAGSQKEPDMVAASTNESSFEETPKATSPLQGSINAPKAAHSAPPSMTGSKPAQDENVPGRDAPRRMLTRRPRQEESKPRVLSDQEQGGMKSGPASPSIPSLDDLFAELEADSAAAAANVPLRSISEDLAATGGDATTTDDETCLSDSLAAPHDSPSSSNKVIVRSDGVWKRAGSAGRAVTAAVGRVVGFPIAVTGHFTKAAIQHIPAALVLLVFALI